MNNLHLPFYHRSLRLKGWDYSRPGAYFVTICVKNRECIFGEIKKSEMRLNEFGIIVRNTWEWLATQYPYVKLDEYQVMPNHFHGIIWIEDPNRTGINNGNRRGGSRTAPPGPHKNISDIIVGTYKIKPVGRLIGAYKTVSTKQINLIRQTPGALLWQRDFYTCPERCRRDHIGRDEKELYRYRHYIRNNPANWGSNDENSFGKSPRYVAMPNPQTQMMIKIRKSSA